MEGLDVRRPIDRRAFNIAYKGFLERCLADLEYDLSIVKSDIDRLSAQLRDLENEKSELTERIEEIRRELEGLST
jgi:predicted  nucleic acid-binding Zn-ribbon protein